MNCYSDPIKSLIERVFADELAEIASRLSRLTVKGETRRFVVSRMGSTGSTWLAKLLNSHPEVYCSHEEVASRVYPATECTGEDVLKFIQCFACDTKHGAYQAIGDVGSVWTSHLPSLPMFRTAILVRHPARLLKTRLTVYPVDQAFSAIPIESRVCIRELLGIDMHCLQPIDQIFLHDLLIFASQIRTLDKADLVIRIEDLQEVEECQSTLKALTGLDYDRAVVENAVRNRINRRTNGPAQISQIVEGFTAHQREWYRAMLSDVAPRLGYSLFDDLTVRETAPVRANGRRRPGFTVFLTGLSGAGKSTIANALTRRLLDISRRHVTLLDGDSVRRLLSSELGFSKEHRDLNIRRIGFVAAEITACGGIAICAAIAPYDCLRKELRTRVESAGTFILVHVATPLSVCEQRDIKGLYAKARAGILPNFTGISDPYEKPADAELTIDASCGSVEDEVETIVSYLIQNGNVSSS
jgi:adenylyl-sulfate kinase